MKTHQDPVDSFAYVGNQMILAGWLRSFAFVTGQGFVFKWTRKGTQRVFLIQRIIRDFELAGHPAKAKRFTDACLNPPRFPAPHYSSVCRDFWLNSLSEVSLDFEKNHLWAFTVIIDAEIQQDLRSTSAPDYRKAENTTPSWPGLVEIP